MTSLLQLVDALQDTPDDPIQDLKEAIKAALLTTFSSVNAAHNQFATDLFVNGDVSKVPNLSGVNGETQPIAQFFSGGKFLLPPPNLTSLNTSMVTTLVI